MLCNIILLHINLLQTAHYVYKPRFQLISTFRGLVSRGGARSFTAGVILINLRLMFIRLFRVLCRKIGSIFFTLLWNIFSRLYKFCVSI